MQKSSSGETEIRFKTSGRKPAKSGVRTHGIVEGFQIGKHISLGHGAGCVVSEVNEFTFEAAEEIFGNSVVVGVAPT